MRKSIGLLVLAASALYSCAAPADNRAVQRVTTSADYKRAIAFDAIAPTIESGKVCTMN